MRARPVALAALAVALATHACGPGDGSPADPVDVAYTLPSLYRDPLTTIVEEFNSSGTEVAIELLEQAETCPEMPTKLQADVASGNVADLAMPCFNGLRQFLDAGVAQPIDDLIAADQNFDLDQFNPVALEPFRHDGKLYGLPNASSATVIYYNADLFRQAGLDPDSPPDTWPALLEAARALDDPDENVEGAALSFYGDLFVEEGLFLTNGGEWMDDAETEPTFNNAAGVEVLEFLTQLAREGLMPVNSDSTLSENAFARGEAAIHAGSSSQIGSLEDQASFDMRVAALPRPDDGTPTMALQGTGFLMFAEEPEERAAAWQAMKALTSPEAATEVVRNTGFLSPNLEATRRPGLLGDYLAESPNRAVVSELIADGVPVYEFPGSRHSEIVSVINNQNLLAMRGQKSAEQALDDAAEEVRRLLP